MKTFLRTTIGGAIGLCLCLTAQAQAPLVTTDKDDYAPGETVHITASNFLSLELIDFSIGISDDNGGWIPDVDWAEIPADESGTANIDYVVPQTWADKTLQLTAMGLTSGLIATTTFTDHSPPPVLSFSNWSISASGNTVTFSVDVSFASGSSGHTIDDVDAFATSSPSGNDLGNINLTGPGGNGVGTWSGSTTGVCGTTYTFTKTNVHVENIGTPDHNINNNNNPSVQTATTDPCPTPTPVPTVTPTPTPNSTPVITCASATTPTPTPVPLGQIVGCLNDDNELGTSVDVTYSVEQVDANNFNVVATFSSAGNPTAIFATVNDPDGNLQLANVVVNPTMQTLTFTGPGFDTQAFSTTITATDDDGASDEETCGGDATVQVTYGNLTFLPPLDGQRNTKVKRGSGVPVKFTLMDGCGNLITTGEHHIDVVYASGSAPMGDPTVDDAGASAGDPGDTFRYSTDDMLWIFNLKTNNTYYVGNSYWINANLDDGTTRQVQISIK